MVLRRKRSCCCWLSKAIRWSACPWTAARKRGVYDCVVCRRCLSETRWQGGRRSTRRNATRLSILHMLAWRTFEWRVGLLFQEIQHLERGALVGDWILPLGSYIPSPSSIHLPHRRGSGFPVRGKKITKFMSVSYANSCGTVDSSFHCLFSANLWVTPSSLEG